MFGCVLDDGMRVIFDAGPCIVCSVFGHTVILRLDVVIFYVIFPHSMVSLAYKTHACICAYIAPVLVIAAIG